MSESLCEFLYPAARTHADVSRDRKREAGTPVGEPDSKKTKLDSVEVDPTSAAATPVSKDGMEDVVKCGKQSVEKSETKGMVKEKGVGAFKESPYAYLSPDDPILQQCM